AVLWYLHSFPTRRSSDLALALAGGLAWVLRATRVGKLLLAVIHDPEMSRALGVNVDRFYLVTFTLGCFLAALGGSFTAPTVSVEIGRAPASPPVTHPSPI